MSLEDIRDIKPPLGFPGNPFLLILFFVLIILAGIYFLVKFLLKKKHRRSELQSCRVSWKSPYQKAIEALEALQEKNLPSLGRVKEFYFELSDIARHYLEERFSLRAPEMTTEEFLRLLQTAGSLSSDHKSLLKNFLRHCDLVKFAKYAPSGEEMKLTFDCAKRMIEETREPDEQITEGVPK